MTFDPHMTSLLVIAIMGAFLLHRVMAGKNHLEWWQFISTRGADGKQYADLDKLGKVVGIVVSSWVMVKVADADKLDLTGFALVLGAYLAFVGGVAGYSAYLRTRQTTDDDKGILK